MVPDLVQRFVFGDRYSMPGSGDLETSIQLTWLLSPGLVMLLIIATAAVMAVVHWYESPSASRVWKVILAGTRTLLVGLVVLMLYGWTMQQHHSEQPEVVIVLDDSASMGLVDHFDDARLAAAIRERLAKTELTQATRLNLAKALLLENDGSLLRQLRKRYSLRFYLAGASARPLDGIADEVTAVLRQATAEQSASRLGESLRDVLEGQRGRPTAAILLFSDGVTTDGQPILATAHYARRKAVPLFFIGLGSDRPSRDLRLADLLADEAAFAGDLLRFDVRLLAEGFRGAATVRLKVKRGDRGQETGDKGQGAAAGSRGSGVGGEGEELVDEQMAQLDPQEAMKTVRLSHRQNQPGEFEYIVEVVPQAGEVNTDNNRLMRKVSVREETIRVLLAQAYPSYEFRFLKQVLLRELNEGGSAEDDNSLGVRTILQEADLEYTRSDKTAERSFPSSREELFQYDVLILGDLNPALLSPSILEQIHEFVTIRGGGVIFISGPRYMPVAYRDTPLARLFPMNLEAVQVPDPQTAIMESFRPRLTPLGLASPTTHIADSVAGNQRLWSEELAPLRWFVSISDLRPGVRVLAEHPTRRSDAGLPLPIICIQFVGAGKVVFHATDETHRWRFRVGDAFFARYWVQTIRYLCRAKLLDGNRSAELTSDRQEYRQGDDVRLRVRFLDDRLAPEADDGVAVAVQRQGGARRSVTLVRQASKRGLFEGSAGALEEGSYRAWVVAPALEGELLAHEFGVVAPPGEMARTQMDAAGLREAAKISGGKFYGFANALQVLNDLPQGRQVRIESLPPRPIWNAPLVASLFVLLLTAEWLLRKRVGLL